MPVDKRTAPVTVHLREPVKKVLRQLSTQDQRTVSTFVSRIVEEHPMVRIALQQITKSGDSH